MGVFFFYLLFPCLFLMAYRRRIVGARSDGDSTVLRVDDGGERFDVRLMEAGGFERVDTGQRLERLIDADKVELHRSDSVVDWMGRDTPEVLISLGEVVSGDRLVKGMDTLANRRVVEVPNPGGRPHKTRFFRADSQDALMQIAFVPREAGDMGFARLTVFDDYLSVSPIYVPEHYGGMGLGRRLLREAEGVAREFGRDCLTAAVHKENRESNRLFKSMGYEAFPDTGRDNVWRYLKKL
jgi:GNAT superfamily N-acetyltransferase